MSEWRASGGLEGRAARPGAPDERAGPRTRGGRWLALGLLALVAIVAFVPRGRVVAAPPGAPARVLPAEIVSPPPFLPLRFSHAKHAGPDFPCLKCHPRASTSTASQDLLLPGMKECVECHEEARVPKGHGLPGHRDTKTCRRCHQAFTPQGFPEPVRWKPPRFRFSHRLHLDRGARCATCHQGMERASRERAEDARHLPKMRLCLGCHRGGAALGGEGGTGKLGAEGSPSKAPGRRASARCVTCHEREPQGRMRARYPEGALRPGPSLAHLEHGADFVRGHRVAAQAHRGECEACHRQDQCLRCHAGVRRPASIHLGDWTRLHGREARANRQKCQSCHTRQRFCASCHRRVGLQPTSATSPYGVLGQQRFHGDRWASTAGGGVARNRHAVNARRNISSCASCHREADCLRCHARTRVGGLGQNPHGPGFRHSRRCRKLLRKNQRSCLKCHGSGDPLLVLCR